MQAQEPRQPVFPLEREGREELMFQLKGSQAGGVLSYLGSGVWGQLGSQAFVLFRPSVDWMRPAHIRDSNLLYTVY